MRQDENYIAIVAMEHTFYRQETIYAILIVAIYLILASLCIIYMIFRVMREKFEKEKLFYTSTTDAITKCLNRRAYEEDIARLDPLEEWIYISLDLNGLKHENDTYGHVAGDELICAAAGFMESSFHEYGKQSRNGKLYMILQKQQTIGCIRVRKFSILKTGLARERSGSLCRKPICLSWKWNSFIKTEEKSRRKLKSSNFPLILKKLCKRES